MKLSPSLCACVCWPMMSCHYGEYVSEVVCNFSSFYWTLPVYPWKNWLHAHQQAEASQTPSLNVIPALVDSEFVCLFMRCI